LKQMELGRTNYEKARKLGIKTVNQYKSNGWNAHVPSLDAILSRESIVSEVNLGLTEIPIKKIKGTRTNARRNAFAPDFMPILGPSTEFAAKWVYLYEAHVEEGIREPIKVYEYLNWYYVEEGNKRVSVLSYSEAILISAYVTRLIPRYDKEDKTIVIYYEFLEFYKNHQINYLWFTEVGSFVKMHKIIEKYDWHQEEKKGDLRSIYYQFKTLYKKLGGDQIPITTGDAFLQYLDVYPYREGIVEVLEENLKSLWAELEIIGSSNKYERELSPSELEKKPLFFGLTNLPFAMKEAKIAFLHAKSKDSSAWTYGHEIGRLHLENVMGDSVTTTCINNVPEDEQAYDYLKAAAEEDYDIIFTTSPTFIHETLKASLAYEQVKFLNCSESLSYRHFRTYFGRIFEPNFLVGMIAGAMSKTNQLGYVVTYPIPEVISSINAYALGARFLNPFAEVFVKWVDDTTASCEDACYKIDEQLMDMGVDIICHQESTDLKTSLNHSGIYFADELRKGQKPICLASPHWHWGVFYEKIVRNIMSGNYNKISGLLGNNERAISYWWGMDAGVVDIMYSESKLPEPLINSVTFMKKMITDGVYHPFTGPLYNQKKELMVETGTHISNEAILDMNWFVDGVNGSIPSINAKEQNHKLLELFSVKKKY